MSEFIPQFPQFAQNYAELPYGARAPVNNYLNTLTAPGATNAQLFRAQNLMGGVSPLQSDLFGIPRANSVAHEATQYGMRGGAINAMTPPTPATPPAAMPGQGALSLEQQAARSRLASAFSGLRSVVPMAGRVLGALASPPAQVAMLAHTIATAPDAPDSASVYRGNMGAHMLGLAPQAVDAMYASHHPTPQPDYDHENLRAAQMTQPAPQPQMMPRRPMPPAAQYTPMPPMDDSAMDYAATQPVASQGGRFDNDTYRRAYAALGLIPQ